MQCLRNQRLTHLGAITIRSVDEIHAKLERAMQNSSGVAQIPGPSPGRISAQTHGAEPQAIDGQVAELNRSGERRAFVKRLFHLQLQLVGVRSRSDSFAVARAQSVRAVIAMVNCVLYVLCTDWTSWINAESPLYRSATVFIRYLILQSVDDRQQVLQCRYQTEPGHTNFRSACSIAVVESTSLRSEM